MLVVKDPAADVAARAGNVHRESAVERGHLLTAGGESRPVHYGETHPFRDSRHLCPATGDPVAADDMPDFSLVAEAFLQLPGECEGRAVEVEEIDPHSRQSPEGKVRHDRPMQERNDRRRRLFRTRSAGNDNHFVEVPGEEYGERAMMQAGGG